MRRIPIREYGHVKDECVQLKDECVQLKYECVQSRSGNTDMWKTNVYRPDQGTRTCERRMCRVYTRECGRVKDECVESIPGNADR